MIDEANDPIPVALEEGVTSDPGAEVPPPDEEPEIEEE